MKNIYFSNERLVYLRGDAFYEVMINKDFQTPTIKPTTSRITHSEESKTSEISNNRTTGTPKFQIGNSGIQYNEFTRLCVNCSNNESMRPYYSFNNPFKPDYKTKILIDDGYIYVINCDSNQLNYFHKVTEESTKAIKTHSEGPTATRESTASVDCTTTMGILKKLDLIEAIFVYRPYSLKVFNNDLYILSNDQTNEQFNLDKLENIIFNRNPLISILNRVENRLELKKQIPLKQVHHLVDFHVLDNGHIMSIGFYHQGRHKLLEDDSQYLFKIRLDLDNDAMTIIYKINLKTTCIKEFCYIDKEVLLAFFDKEKKLKKLVILESL
jgi:hypothetical protein